jgi:hypothetical protein
MANGKHLTRLLLGMRQDHNGRKMPIACQAIALVRLKPFLMNNDGLRRQHLQKILNKRLTRCRVKRLVESGKLQFAGLPLQSL